MFIHVLGAMVAYVIFVQRFFDPVRMLSMQYTIMQRAMAAGHQRRCWHLGRARRRTRGCGR